VGEELVVNHPGGKRIPLGDAAPINADSPFDLSNMDVSKSRTELDV